jgi:hypothetical protein
MTNDFSGEKENKADNGNRTHIVCVEGKRFTFNPYPHITFLGKLQGGENSYKDYGQ